MVFELFLENPYFSAGAGLIGLGTVGAMLRQGMLRYSHLVKRQFLVSLEVSSRDKSYQWLLHWITKKTQTKSHHLSVQTLYKIHENGSAMTQFQFVPCPGIHYVRWMGRYFKVERQREKSLAAAGSLGTDFSNPAAPFETLTMTTIGRNPQVFTEILEEASEIALMKQQGKTVIYTSWANEWRPFGQPHQKRPLESVILANSISDAILKDVQEFNRNEDWYHTRG